MKAISRFFVTLGVVGSLFAATLDAAHARPAARAAVTDRGMTLSTDITQKDIADLGVFGANLGRYQFVYGNANTANEAEYMAWLDSRIAVLDGLLPSFQAAGIRVIIDLHTPPGGFISEQSPAWHRIFAEPWAPNALLTAWTKLASHYANNPVIYGYDIVNEPAERQVNPGLKAWSDLALDVIAAIRAVDPTHVIFVQPIYGNQAFLKKLKVIPQTNVVYSFHMYFPLNFQQQGLYGFPLGVKYPKIAKNPKNSFDKARLARALNDVVKFQRKHKVAIYVGEFSAVRWAPGKSALNYLRDVVSLFEKNKWIWTYHSWREADPWSVEHDGNINNRNPVNFVTDRAGYLKNVFRKNS